MRSTILTLLAGTAFLAACGDGTSPTGARVSLSFTTGGSSAQTSVANGFSASIVGAAGVEFTDGTNTLRLDSVKMVLREIELERLDDDCDDLSGAAEDTCEEFEFGPVLVSLPLAGVAKQFTIDVPPGTYDELEFDIHKPDDDTPEDIAFLNAHPDFQRVSSRVWANYNGTDVVYETDLNEEQEHALVPPLTVGSENRSVNLTLFIDLSTWFRDAQGMLVNPASANKGGVHENLVKDNIKASIEAFEDDDEDGIDD